MALRGHAFRSNQNLLWKQKASNGILTTQMTKEPYHSLSHICHFPVLANHLLWMTYDDTDRKEKVATHSSFPFSSTLLSSKLELVLVECVHLKKWNKNSWVSFLQLFHHPSENEIHMHAWATRQGWTKVGLWLYVTQSLLFYCYLLIIVLFICMTTVNLLLPTPIYELHNFGNSAWVHCSYNGT